MQHHPLRRRLAAAAAAAVALSTVAAAAGAAADGTVTGAGPRVAGLVASLEDDVRDTGEGLIRWATRWRLCWQPTPGAAAYELQALTGEGASPRLLTQADRCFAIQVASGENPADEGLAKRGLQLAMQRSQLSFRVRAVGADGRPGAWSEAAEVGAVIDQPG